MHRTAIYTVTKILDFLTPFKIPYCRSYRGADIFSDHELVISKIKLKLKSNGQDKINQIGRQFDSSILKINLS